MNKKIALIGSHGTGKTTIAHGLCHVMKLQGLNVEQVTEVARTSPLPINENTTLDAQLWILVTQIKREIELATRADYLVCDRSVLDNYAYYRIAAEKDENDGYPGLSELMFDWIETYDLLIYVEPDMELEDDGVRSTDVAFQQQVNDMVKHLIDLYEYETGNTLPIIVYKASDFMLGEKEEKIKKFHQIAEEIISNHKLQLS